MLNLDDYANEFIEAPSYSNPFYPQIDSTRVRLVIQFGVSKFKINLRTTIQHQMDSESNSNIFDVSSIQSPVIGSLNRLIRINNRCVPLNSINLNSGNSLETNSSSENLKTKYILIADIEALTIKMLKDISNENNVEILIPNSKKWDNFKIENKILTVKKLSSVVENTVSFKYLSCRHHLAIILYILSEVYHLLITNITCTERELYYANPELCENQLKISRAIRDVCSILKASPWDLGIRSSSKGLIAGAVRIHLLNHVVIDCYLYDGPSLIPDVTCIRLIETTAKFVLIVEKDTVFEKLLKQNILLDMNMDIIFITGKGYPDLNTRLLIKRIWKDFHLPIFALVDADPFGVDILLVYRFGSKTMALNADQLACPQISWIGIHPTEIETLAIPSLPLCKRDHKKIIELLQRSYVTGPIRNELEMLQKLNCKAELESVTRFSTNFLVSDYVPNKIKRELVL